MDGPSTTSEEIEGWRAGLDGLHDRIAGRFRWSEARERAKRYLAGLEDRRRRCPWRRPGVHSGRSIAEVRVRRNGEDPSAWVGRHRLRKGPAR